MAVRASASTRSAAPSTYATRGAKTTGLGSGVVGDFIGDVDHHGGRDQALYSFAREQLDAWQDKLGRELPNGYFGENLTTRGIGERWRIGSTVEVQVTCPRIPCATLRGWIGDPSWLKTFTAAARPDAYLRMLVPGAISGGDALEVVHRPTHDITGSLMFRALTAEPELLPELLAAGDDLPEEPLRKLRR